MRILKVVATAILVALLQSPNMKSISGTSKDLYLRFNGEIDKDHYVTYIATISTTNPDEPSIVKRQLANADYYGDEWSPQTGLLTYISNKGIGIRSPQNPAGTIIVSADHLHTLFSPSLSPDGKHIVYIEASYRAKDSNQRFSINVASLSGNSRIIFDTQDFLPDLPYYAVSFVRWAPDGAFIAFYGQPQGEVNEGNIYLISTDCLNKLTKCVDENLNITDDSGIRPIGRSGLWGEDWSSPAWSPDGKQIAFMCSNQICLLNRDGTQFKRVMVSNQSQEALEDINATGNLEWSPNGNYIAYRCYGVIGKDVNTVSTDICLLNVNTLVATKLTDNTSEESNILWLTFPDADFLVQK